MKVAVLVTLALMIAGCGGSEPPDPPEHGSPGRAHAAPPETVSSEERWAGLPRGWSRLAPLPFWRRSPAAVWTGHELLVWGGDAPSDVVHHAGGAAFDREARRWRLIPAAPIDGRSQAAAVWSGSEMLVWGGLAGRPLLDGAAYDPRTKSWRRLPDAPLGARVPATVVWTGGEMIVWGDADRSKTDVSGAAYDPRQDRWRALPPAPLALNEASAVWTGREMVVIGSLLDGNNRSKSGDVKGAAYDPATDSWRVIPAHTLSPQASSSAWTGSDVLVWDYELEAATYEPSSDRWHSAPALPLEFSECYPQSARVGRVVVGWFCGRGAVYDSAHRLWQRIPARRGAWLGPISAGSVALFLGGGGLLAYKP